MKAGMSDISAMPSVASTSTCFHDNENSKNSAGGPNESNSLSPTFKYEYKEQNNADNVVVPMDSGDLSKNQLKKLKRKQEWEANREARKAHRKEKIKMRKQKKKNIATRDLEQGDILQVESSASSTAPAGRESNAMSLQHQTHGVQVPIAFILDCQFDDLMLEHEMVSLAGQITRCYSDNRKARNRAHLAISSFNGNLKARFEGILLRSHESWRGVRFSDEDFVQVTQTMKSWMRDSKDGIESKHIQDHNNIGEELQGHKNGEVVYLSSDSPNILTELKPYGTYIVGGLVDHNRHKGICFKRAEERQVRTAKLPIGKFLNMQGRSVLATNHVIEIMLKWLELRDWGQAFMQVIPKRKGTSLKTSD